MPLPLNEKWKCSVLSNTDWHFSAVGAQGTFDTCPSKKFLLQYSRTRSMTNFCVAHCTKHIHLLTVVSIFPHHVHARCLLLLMCSVAVSLKTSLPGSCLPTLFAGRCCRCLIWLCLFWTLPTVTSLYDFISFLWRCATSFIEGSAGVGLHTCLVNFIGPLMNLPTYLTVALETDVRHWLEYILYTQLQWNLLAKVPLTYMWDAVFCVLFENNIA
jgi:hypothetical protein